MMIKRLVLLFISVSVSVHLAHADQPISAADVVSDIYSSCISQLSISCVKPKALAWLSQAVNENEIKINGDMTIIKTSDDEPTDFNQQRNGADAKIQLFDKIDSFLSTHSLKIEVPEILKIEEARALIPESYLKGGLGEGITIPLVDGNPVQGRSFVKKVLIPFFLGLKLKTTVLVPLALAMIAVKAWKAITLSLLSLVLGGAIVIFKVLKPKIVNYEVVHYPHHHHLDHHHLDHHHLDHHHHHLDHLEHHHLDHHLEHHLDHHLDHHLEHHALEHPLEHHLEHHDHAHVVEHAPHHIEHHPVWEPAAGWARQLDAQQMAYSNHL